MLCQCQACKDSNDGMLNFKISPLIPMQGSEIFGIVVKGATKPISICPQWYKHEF